MLKPNVKLGGINLKGKRKKQSILTSRQPLKNQYRLSLPNHLLSHNKQNQLKQIQQDNNCQEKATDKRTIFHYTSKQLQILAIEKEQSINEHQLSKQQLLQQNKLLKDTLNEKYQQAQSLFDKINILEMKICKIAEQVYQNEKSSDNYKQKKSAKQRTKKDKMTKYCLSVSQAILQQQNQSQEKSQQQLKLSINCKSTAKSQHKLSYKHINNIAPIPSENSKNAFILKLIQKISFLQKQLFHKNEEIKQKNKIIETSLKS